MIGAYWMINYDINGEKTAKLMTFAKSNIDEKSKSAPSYTDFSRIYPYILWQGINKAVLSRTLLNVQDNIWYKEYFKIITKFIFFHLIYCSFENNEHVKRMLLIYVSTLLMYAGESNTYEINYFVSFLYTCMYWYNVMHVSKVEIYKGKHNEVH